MNRVQLTTYYGVGRYLSQYTRKGVWGTGALKTIIEQLQREMPNEEQFAKLLEGYNLTEEEKY